MVTLFLRSLVSPATTVSVIGVNKKVLPTTWKRTCCSRLLRSQLLYWLNPS
jgi:hypothetical protein